MEPIEAITLLLILITNYFSYRDFQAPLFFEQYTFEIDGILFRKECFRLLGSAFLHGSWLHLIPNMAVLYSFSFSVGNVLGVRNFLFIYFGSLLGANCCRYTFTEIMATTAPLRHRVGIGVIFASIPIFSGSRMSPIFLPFQMLAWLFGTLFILLSI